MKFPSLLASLLVGCVALSSTGCAVFTKGKKQMVVVRSTPEAATTKINGYEVGKTPLKVELARNNVFRVDVSKPGFEDQSALLLPSSANYDARFLRWGLDYDLGAATDLVPSELVIAMKPALGETTSADRYTEMSAQVARADALLASGDLTAADHKYLVDQILATYNAAL